MDEESALGNKEKDRIALLRAGRRLKVYRASFTLEYSPEKCSLCESCVEVCPTRAIAREDRRLYVDAEKCIACYGCIIVCPRNCYSIKWVYEEQG